MVFEIEYYNNNKNKISDKTQKKARLHKILKISDTKFLELRNQEFTRILALELLRIVFLFLFYFSSSSNTSVARYCLGHTYNSTFSKINFALVG